MNDITKDFLSGLNERGSKNKKEFDINTDAAALAPFIDEALIVKDKIELYKGSLKDIKERAKDELGIKPKLFNQILNMRFKRNRDLVEEENEELIELYDSIYPAKSDEFDDSDE